MEGVARTCIMQALTPYSFQRGKTMPDPEVLEWLSIALSVIGTFLLFLEVWRGHRFERMSIELEILRENLEELERVARLSTGSDRDFYIAFRRYSTDESIQASKAFGDELGDKAMGDAVAEIKQNLPGEVADAMADLAAKQHVFRTRFATAQLHRRSQLLWSGFALLMLSAALHLMATLTPVNAPRS